ncbi:MAG: hypothetical protein M3O25_09620, partial [Actinomycetota bacterium]|nr:hypothetical protein [Actinomycetota bacterium]
ASLVLAACGGDDGGSDDDEITEAIEQASTSDSAERCTEVQTQAFTEQTQFSTGEDAVTSCEEGAGDGENAGESVEVEGVEVDGDSATADVTFIGGGLDGQVLAISLLKEEDKWKVDSLDEFLSFDKAAFSAALLEQSSSDSEIPEQVVTCLEQALSSTPDEQLQAAYLSGDQDQLLALFGPCFGVA